MFINIGFFIIIIFDIELIWGFVIDILLGIIVSVLIVFFW